MVELQSWYRHAEGLLLPLLRMCWVHAPGAAAALPGQAGWPRQQSGTASPLSMDTTGYCCPTCRVCVSRELCMRLSGLGGCLGSL